MNISTPFYDVILAALGLAAHARVMVELGTYEGRTTALLAHTARLTGGHVWSVDNGKEGVNPEAVTALLRESGLGAYVTLLTGDTRTWAWEGPPIDLLFMDADHSWAGVEQEWRTWAPFVRRGGMVMVHDVGSGDPHEWARSMFPRDGWSHFVIPYAHGVLLAYKHQEGDT